MVAGYITLLATEGKTISTIKTYLCAVRAVQLDAGYAFVPWQERHLVYMTLQGARRLLGDSHKRMAAITIDMLTQMAPEVQRMRQDPKLRVWIGAVWAAMLVGFFGMLRKDNLTKGKPDPFHPFRGLRRGDVDISRQRIWLRLRVAKTAQFGEEPHVLGLEASGCDLCPVRAVRQHLDETAGLKADSYLFVSKGKGARGAAAVPLSHTSLVRGIKMLVRAIGADPVMFSGHSLRRGGASFAYDVGIPEVAIQAHGNWRSEAVRVYREWSVAQRLVLPSRLAHAARARARQVGRPAGHHHQQAQRGHREPHCREGGARQEPQRHR